MSETKVINYKREDLSVWRERTCYYCKKDYITEAYSNKSEYYLFELDGQVIYVCSICCHTTGHTFETPLDIWKKEHPVEEDTSNRIYVTTEDFEKFKFCTRNWACKLLYRIFGK